MDLITKSMFFNVFQVVKLQITEEAAACTQLMAHDT